MNSLILSLMVVIIAIFHRSAHQYVKKDKILESFCATWCMDAVFSVCGIILSFVLYRYCFSPIFTLRNLLFLCMYLVATALFVLLAPSGPSILRKKKTSSGEEILLAEYRFNDTLCLIRNFFLTLLFIIPAIFALLPLLPAPLPLIANWREEEMCGGLCFIAFLVLVPVSLRQSLFWLRGLTQTGDFRETEARLLRGYRLELHYRSKNRIL